MAYNLKKSLGYGDGRLGTVSNPTSTINSYANVTAISGTTLTVDMTNKYEGLVKFVVGEQVMVHVSGTTGVVGTYLGLNRIATILAISGNTVTLDKDVSDLLPADQIATHYIQILTIAQFDTLNLSADISPIAYDAVKKYGGIIAIKCKTALNMTGNGRIYLVDKGIPTANSALRVLTTQETEMTSTGNTYGWENHVTSRQLLLNVGDGCAFIQTLKTVLTGTTNRIGSTAAGTKYYPYSTTDHNPSEVLGGSSILFISDTINSFDVSLISKGKGSGKGYGRCYIATNTALPADEQLYAQDCISDFNRIVKLGIKNFGNGSLGNVTNPSGQLNSYIAISTISADGLNYTVGSGSTGAYGGFLPETKVMIHLSAIKAGTDYTNFGKFYVTKIVSINGSVITLKDKAPFTIDLNSYYVQMITIPEFNTLTINTAYSAALAWNDTSKIGGICAISCKDTLDLTNGSILMTSKGLPVNSERPAILTQCSGQQKDYLPISQGSGSVLILSNIIKLNATSRIGNSLVGINYSGIYGYGYTSNGGYPGSGGNIFFGGNGGYSEPASGQSGGNGGIKSSALGISGSNGTDGYYYKGNGGYGGAAGASIFIISDTINTFNISTISTGGWGGNPGLYTGGIGYGNYGTAGGAGYGGGGAGGGASGGGGGGAGASSGTCFIYCNKTTTPDYTAVVL